MGDKKKVVFGIIIFLLIISVGVVFAEDLFEVICSSNSDCGHDGCAGASNYCCGNEVCQEWIFFSCHNPRTSESFCSNVTSPLMLENCTSQDLVCKKGFCIPPECRLELDNDCGGESYSDNYCYEDDVVRDHMTPFCEAYECKANVETDLVEDCGEDYLGDWRDDYCKDNDVYHNRTWHYKGCSIGLNVCHDNERIEEQKVETCKWGCSDDECINKEIACYEDNDCGIDSFVGNDYCLFGDIYESWVDYTCHNPGTNGSFCSNYTEPVLMDECEFGCEDGFCVDEECQENLDCGEEELINNYCAGNEIWSNYSIPVCGEDRCEINYTQIFNQTCEFGCGDGECIEGIHDVALIDFSGSVGGIKITSNGGTGNFNVLNCSQKYRVYINVINLGNFYENVSFEGEIDSLLFNHLPIDNFEPGDDSLKYRTINFTLEKGFYNITVEAIINEDINLSNNFAEREIEVVCPVCAPEENETRICGSTDIGECQFGEQIRACNEERQWGDWSECVGNIDPVNETCDGLDNNCNNETDEGLDCEEGNCDARSKGYWKNNEGCFQGEGESLWESEVNNLSDSFFDVFVEINGSEICILMDENCDSDMLCKAKQMLLADLLNVVSDKLQLNAIVAGAVNGYEESFDNLSLNSSSSIEQALEKVEQVISDENSSEDDLEDTKNVAERIYEFYENENPDYPECLYEWDDNDNNGNSDGNNNGNGGGGGGRSSAYNIEFCGNGICGAGENKFNCEEDCKSLNLEILSYGVEDLNENTIQSEVAAKTGSKILPLALLISIFLMLLSVFAFFIIKKK